VDPYAEEESLKTMREQFYEEVCSFSIDAAQFGDWLSTKKTQKLMTQRPATASEVQEPSEG